MQLTDVTALARPIDPRYPTNLAISVVSLLVGAGGTLYRLLSGAGWVDALLWGIGAALALFLAWALARELDPDHDLSAFLAAALALAGLVLLGLPALLPLFWLLMLVRVVNRTTGVPARPLDTLAVIGLAGWLAWQGMWVAALVTAVAFLLDGILPNPLRRHLAFAAIALAGAVATILLLDVPVTARTSPTWWLAMATTALLLVVLSSTSWEVASTCDVTGERLTAVRVLAARAIALLAGLLWGLQPEPDGIVTLVPLWAALVGMLLWDVLLRLVAHRDARREDLD